MSSTIKEPKLIGSLVKAVDILRCFETREEIGVSELSTLLDMHKSTVFSLISTLEHLKLLEKSEDSKKYRLGIELFRLGSLVNLNVRHVARYELECLQEKVNETVHLARRDDVHMIFMERFESAYTMKIYTVDAKPLPVYAVGVGKAILSTLDDPVLADLMERMRFEPLTQHTIVNPAALEAELKKIRERGYAIDNEELEDGLYCIAAPLYDWRGKADYAISVSGPKIRTAGEKFETIKNLVVETAAAISEKLGYRNGGE